MSDETEVKRAIAAALSPSIASPTATKKTAQTLAKRVRELERERDRIERRCQECYDKLGEWQEYTGCSHPTAAKDQLSEAQADAARWRYVRDRFFKPYFESGGWYFNSQVFYGSNPDEALGKAMKEQVDAKS